MPDDLNDNEIRNRNSVVDKIVRQIEGILREKLEQKISNPPEDYYLCKTERISNTYWHIDEQGRLGVRTYTAILTQYIDWAAWEFSPETSFSLSAFSTSIYETLRKSDPCSIPVTSKTDRATGNKKPWTEKTFYNWFRYQSSAPSLNQASAILRCVAQKATKYLKNPNQTADQVLALLLSGGDDVGSAVTALVAASKLPREAPSWLRPETFVPSIGPSFTSAPSQSPFDTDCADYARQIYNQLKAENGAVDAAVIMGPALSGKKTVARFIVQSHLNPTNHYLRFPSGVELPTLAISVDDHTPEAFIETVYKFFLSARQKPVESTSLRRLSCDEKMSTIFEIAAAVPALVIIADVAAIDENMWVRASCRDHVGQLIYTLLRGHPLTRLIITTGEPVVGDLVSEQLGGRPGRPPYKLLVGVPLSKALMGLGLETKSPTLREEVTVSWQAYRTAKLALELAEKRHVLSEIKIETRRALSLGERESLSGLVRLVFDRVLTKHEQWVIGYLATSEYGLRASALCRLFAAARRDEKESADRPDLNDDQIHAILGPLDCLITKQAINVEPATIYLSQSEREPIFKIRGEDSRNYFLQYWCAKHPRRARFGHWLIARDLADESRRMRESEGRRSINGFNRDVQFIRALIASVNVETLEKIDASENIFRLDNAEREVAPPLADPAQAPDPRAVIQYAVEAFRRDIEVDDHQVAMTGYDAVVRMSILLRLFNPESPWAKLEDQPLSYSLARCRHIKLSLGPEAMLDLLVSVAICALRIQRYDLLTAAARLGEALFDSICDLPPVNYMRLMRAETDAGVLLGSNPSVRLPIKQIDWSTPVALYSESAYKLEWAAERIQGLLGEPFAEPQGSPPAPERLLARGKLQARLAEVHHLLGQPEVALCQFHEVHKHEKSLREARPDGGVMAAPILGGRGIHSLVRLHLDLGNRGELPIDQRVCIFEDGVRLPFQRDLESSEALRQAYNHHIVNVRRMSKRRLVDAICVQINAARIAAAQHDYARALRLLDRAASPPFGVGASPEFFLELMAVWCRLLIDAAVLALVVNADEYQRDASVVETGRSCPPQQRIRADNPRSMTPTRHGGLHPATEFKVNVARYLGLPDKTGLLDVARALHNQTSEKLGEFGRIFTSRLGPIKSDLYEIDLLYLIGLNKLVGSRLDPWVVSENQPDMPHLLLDVESDLKNATDGMEAKIYKLHYEEASEVLRGVRDALGTSGTV